MSQQLKKPAVLFCLLVVAALLFRLPATDAGLPYCWHPDEPKLINKGIEILQTGDWNPHWFHYPSLPIYIQTVGAALSYLSSMGETDFVKLAEIPTGLENGLIHTIGDAEMWQRGRKLTALMGALCAGLTFLAGRRLFDDGRIGALAGFFVAFSQYHVVHSRFITVDVPTSMAVAGLLLASAWVFRAGERRHYLQAAVALGFVIGFKYNAAVAAVVPLAAWLLSERRAERLWFGLLLVPVAGVVFVMTMPFALTDVSTALTDMAKEVNHYMYRGHDSASVESGPTHLLKMLKSVFVDYLPVWAVGVFGLAFAGRERWRPALVVAAFPIVYLLYMSGSAVFFKRNVVVLVPAIAVLAATGFVWGFDALAPRLGDRAALAAKVGALLLLLPAGFAAKETWTATSYSEDTRTQITTWLAEEAPKDWVVAVPAELGLAAEELDGFQHVEVSLLDGGKGWREAGATHVIGSGQLKRKGVRKTVITDEAVSAGATWFGKREPVRVKGNAAWNLDLYSRNPEVGVYEVGGNLPASAEGEGPVPAPVVEGEVDSPERWQVVPAESPLVAFEGGLIRLDAPGGGAPVKVCEADRNAVGDRIRVTGRWRYEGVTRERMAGQLTARFFAGDGSLIEGDSEATKGIQLVAQAAGDADWEELDVLLTTPRGGKKVRLCAELGSREGRVVLDDLRLSD